MQQLEILQQVQLLPFPRYLLLNIHPDSPDTAIRTSMNSYSNVPTLFQFDDTTQYTIVE